jgi:hypothetical protein
MKHILLAAYLKAGKLNLETTGLLPIETAKNRILWEMTTALHCDTKTR